MGYYDYCSRTIHSQILHVVHTRAYENDGENEMKTIIIIISLISILSFLSITIRLFAKQPITFLINIPIDLFNYFYKYRHIPKKPFINVYCGLFGSGKTLSAVHDVTAFYNRYNDKRVYDDRQKKFVMQKVEVLSNVDLNYIPYVKFTSLQQIVDIAKFRHETDKELGVRTVTVILGDEFSVQMNSRNFMGSKSNSGKQIEKNIDPLFLNALLTSRHALIHGFYLTSQRFEHLDALLRQVSTNVIECKKSWRIQKNTYYDAYDREHASDPTKIEPLLRTGFFVRNCDYHAYDTLQVVSNLVKACDEGDMMSADEIRNKITSKDRYIDNIKEKKRK